jgi:hypothetical protein
LKGLSPSEIPLNELETGSEIGSGTYVRFQKGPILEWAVFYTKPDILSPYGYLDI